MNRMQTNARNRPLGYLVTDEEFRSADLPYEGPRATLATVTESLFWPVSDALLEEKLVARGWLLLWTGRVETPYGTGPFMWHWSTPDGRSIIWIRDYGRIPGGDNRARQLNERLFWILWKAGVKSFLAGVHAGAADWRPEAQRVQPGDLVIPWTFEGTSWFNGLPGTDYESTMNNAKVIDSREIPWPYFDEPLAARAGRHFIELCEPLVAAGRVPRAWTPDEVRGVICDPVNIGFETHYEIFLKLATSKLISEMQPDRPPVVTLHGIVLNPVLCRLLEIECLQYQVVSNPGAGMVPFIGTAHDSHVYNLDEALMWLDVEAQFLESYAVA